ncbi:MAG: 30S ribosomal protein S12 methylthiotransferase RimO [Desulfovibrio sp.]|uniref:30S ribosomal protein S12 methylthiotransferase RimO n=1 Tax=Desulfovibrio sp. 7SRBS1 TaxID=3378064 RepID=UPI003B407444
MPIKVHSISLGCPKNRVDTEHLLGSLHQMGGGIVAVEEPDEADLIFINTCGFIAPAVEESVQTILECASAAGEGAGKRPLLAAAGCMVSRYLGQIEEGLPEVDLWLPLNAKERWPAIILKAMGMEAEYSPARLLSTGPSFAYLKICEGCGHNCSFCTIPSIRGPLSSLPQEAIVNDAREMIAQGVPELVVVAQDVTAYGRDRDEKNGLLHLLEKLIPLDGLQRLRLMYLYPAGLTDELLSFLRDAGEPFVPYFDIPVQHSHQGILSAMGRPFARDPRRALDKVRSYIPEAALRTSIIVGFPGETEEHFSHLLNFIEQTRFHHLGVFAYQAEDGTPAAEFADRVPEDVALARRERVMELQAEISREMLEEYAGQRLDIVVDEVSPEWPGLHVGRTWFQAPEVDGVTYLSGPGVQPGIVARAEIVETKTYDLVALADQPED